MLTVVIRLIAKKAVVSMVSSRMKRSLLFLFFFFQAEDGIRDSSVTGVQTCALPISAPRSDGGAGQRAGTPGQDRGADRRQHGGRGLLGLRAARGRHARTLRHRRSQQGGGAPDRAALGRRPRRPGRERGEPDQPVGSAEPSRLLLSGGDGRRDLPLLPRGAGAARRQHARRAGGAEPRAAHLYRGGRGGATDDRDGARGDDRIGGTRRKRQARRRTRRAAAAASYRQ